VNSRACTRRCRRPSQPVLVLRLLGSVMLAGADPDKIAAIVRNDIHGYTPDMLSNAALHRLALFVGGGQVITADLIDRKTGGVRGDAKRGGGLYETLCASCHGLDGRRINFKTPESPEYLGTVATPLGAVAQAQKWPAGRCHAGVPGTRSSVPPGCGRLRANPAPEMSNAVCRPSSAAG